MFGRLLDAFEFWANAHAGWALILLLALLVGAMVLDAVWRVP